DCRDFSLPAAILRDLDINRVRLLSNNPRKARALSDAGIEVVAQIPCEAPPNPHSLAYLRTKKERMGHSLSLAEYKSASLTSAPHTKDLDTYSANEGKTEHQFEFASIEIAIRELRAGRMIVVVDDEDRENEGDLTIAAEMITPEAINFTATIGRGLI